MSRRPPCVPPVNKGTLQPWGLPYKVMAHIKEAGPVTRHDLEQVFRGTPAMTLRNALDALRKSGRIFIVGWERGRGTRSLTVYSDRKPQGKEVVAPLPPISPQERQLRHKQRRRVAVSSVFEWRGQVQMGDAG